MGVAGTNSSGRRLPWSILACLTFTAALGASPRGPGEDPEGIEFYETRVRPLLVDSCERCHGEDKQRADLRVDSRAALVLGGERGPALVPGDPQASLLIQAIRYDDLDLQMPPKGRLSDEEIELLEQWVARGAPAPEGARAEAVDDGFDLEARLGHWSLQPLAETPTPEVPGARMPVDAYLQARLDQAGLAAAVGAAPQLVLRRLSFDLIGLPPTRAELGDFLEAVEGEGFDVAYGRAVERLLASPHFGERWGRHWLDLVRFAETRGHEFDYGIANAWQYRDYVVRAINADLPFDAFLREHLAGDLIEPQRVHPQLGFDESVLGTGFWFLGEQVHSPVDIRGDEVERQAGQIDVVSKAFMGLTIACARCHDHKFDAIPTEDYYALAGYVASTRARQVRFESRAKNREVAEELERLRGAQVGRLAELVGGEFEGALEGLDDTLVAALDVRGADPVDPADLLGDVLFADFESETLEGWTAEGAAFQDGIAANTGLVRAGAVGKGLIDSQRVLAGQGAAAGEAYTGTLTSPEFEVQHKRVNLLVGGGSLAGQTCVQLLVEGQVVAEVTGQDDRRMRSASLDTSGIRGRRARLRVVDLAAGPWGSIALDHVVFSNHDPAQPAPTPEELLAEHHAGLVRAAASEHDVAPQRLEAALDALESAQEDPGSPLHVLVSVLGVERSEEALGERLRGYRERWSKTSVSDPPESIEVVDWGASGSSFIQDGATFGTRPARAGEPWPSVDPSWPLAGLSTRAAARKDPAFDVLELAEGSERESWRMDWDPAGRTLYAPTFQLERGKLHYLVRGVGRVHAEVDSHRMNLGPLHAHLGKTLGGDEFRGFHWIEHDLSDYVGERVSLEFSPAPAKDGRAPRFEVARVLQSDVAPVAEERPSDDLLNRLEGVESLRGVARAVQASLRQAGRTLARGGLTREADLRCSVDWMLRHPALCTSQESRERLAAACATEAARESDLRARLMARSATAPAMIGGSPWSERVLIRGSHASPGDLVAPRPPAAAGGAAGTDVAGDRLALADVLCDPQRTPVVPRVHVNRVWHHLFGRGLVASVDDFGLMGEEPSHPELLDFLARTFVEDGWSTKSLIRRLVHSDAYLRSSEAPPAVHQADPDNLLLARASVRRLDAEAIRDAILVHSGSFDPTLGGPSVPIHLTPFMDGRGRPGESGPLDGRGRRSLYLAVRRNFLVPMLTAFDFPQPASTMGRRGSSNVPAQALTLLNDPFVLEASGRWAARLLELPSTDTDGRVVELYRMAFARPPSEDELALARGFVAAAPEDAATWADLCHVLVNVKEFIFLD